VVVGPLALHADGFEQWLVDRGFSWSSASCRVWHFDHLSRWLEREELCLEEGLTPARLRQFSAAHRAAGYATLSSPSSTRLPLAYLREAGVVPALVSLTAKGHVDLLLADYRRYLARERGLCRKTLYEYERVVRPFLAEREQPGGLALEQLSAADVSLFLARECPKRSLSEAKQLVKGLRSLLRYLHVEGLIDAPLRGAVPGVADLRGRALPRGLEPAAVAKLLASCDPRRAAGQRDYAILVLLVRLGLRACEVAAMRLEDVDWHSGEIVIRGKESRRECLPLPVDVGEALVCYLRCRPQSASRALFLRVNAPRVELTSKAVSMRVRAACARAGLPGMGAHRLRHTAATDMLRAGASLPEIAQVLRHQSLQTTTEYARVDRVALRVLARPWPVGAA
jgi:integrase/recombinase XerD